MYVDNGEFVPKENGSYMKARSTAVAYLGFTTSDNS